MTAHEQKHHHRPIEATDHLAIRRPVESAVHCGRITWKATIGVRLPLLFSNQVLAGGLARAVMEVVLLERAKDLFFDIRGARTLVQSLDRRKADQAEGGV